MAISDGPQPFLKSDAFVGILLLVSAVAALIVSNSALQPYYSAVLEAKFRVGFETGYINKPLFLWINDGLMAIFFLYVGLEVKREFATGQLSNLNAAALPFVGAIGGMVVPALIYVGVITLSGSDAINGWAIPAATDIAFALGLLGLIAARAPIEAKAFLLALAIFDDIGAIVIIALFYTAQLSWIALAFAAGATLLAFKANWLKARTFTPYLVLGIILWVAMLKSGIHATLAGVVIAMAIPMERAGGFAEQLEKDLKPWVNYMIMPIFAFANAGVSLAGFGLATILAPVSLGIALGLVIGKPLGILGLLWVAQRLRLITIPPVLTWPLLSTLAMLAGIGFTMSLFIGGLAFEGDENTSAVRIGVLMGSLIAGLAALTITLFSRSPAHEASGSEPRGGEEPGGAADVAEPESSEPAEPLADHA